MTNPSPPSTDLTAAQMWQLKNVFVKLPRCPRCDSLNLETTGTPKVKELQVVKSQAKRCEDCGHTFRAHWE